MNRRNILKSGIALSLLGFIKPVKADEKLLDGMAAEIEKYFLDSANWWGVDPYKVAGIFFDNNLHRQRRLGVYWWWDNTSGPDMGGSFDDLIKDWRDKYKDFSYVKFEEAVNQVHNKYTGQNRTFIARYNKYLDGQ